MRARFCAFRTDHARALLRSTVSHMNRLLTVTVVFVLATIPAPGQTITGVSLPEPAREVLLDLAKEAGLASIRVSSFERTARRQAELMYDLLESVGVGPVREQYDSIGGSVVVYYEANRSRISREDLLAGMEEVVSAGVRAAPNRQQMMHVLPTNNYTFDVAPSSVTPNETGFAEAILNHAGFDLASYILPGAAERAFHLEVSKTLPTLSGTYAGVCADPERGTVTPITITLTRGDEEYGGLYSAFGEVFPLTLVEIDRRTGRVVLQSDVAGAPFSMTATLMPDYSAVNLDRPGDAGTTCRLERE
jgi:hypothetical protein